MKISNLITAGILLLIVNQSYSQSQCQKEDTINFKMKEFLVFLKSDELSKETNPEFNDWEENDQTRYKLLQRLDVMHEFHNNLLFNKFYKQCPEELKNNPNLDVEHITYLQYVIDTIDCKCDSTAKKGWKTYWQDNQEKLDFNFGADIIKYLQLDQNGIPEDVIAANISAITHQSTIQFVYKKFNRLIELGSINIVAYYQKRNKTLLEARLADIESNQYSHYTSGITEDQKLKSMDFFMDNDMFTDFNVVDFNQDRELTGAGALTFSTDRLKWRFLNSGWFFGNFRNRSTNEVMTYQTFRIGMMFHTPYIRYRAETALADTLYSLDRPFASYAYFERSKYRLWPKGLVRHHGTFQVGQIGNNLGRDIQAHLHKDVILLSQKVYGWDQQIAHGGRFLYQINHHAEVMLYSSTNQRSSIFKANRDPKKPRDRTERYLGFNSYAGAAVMFGGYLTGFEANLTFSGLDFTNQSGQKAIMAKPPGKKMKNRDMEFGFNWELGYRYRYVHHNSSLEGVGYRGTFVDDTLDDESLSVYTVNQEFFNSQTDILEKDQKYYTRPPKGEDHVRRHMHYIDLRLSFRWRKMIVYLHQSYHSNEFDRKIGSFTGSDILGKISSPKEQAYYLNNAVPELESHNNRKFYGVGTVGVTWLID